MIPIVSVADLDATDGALCVSLAKPDLDSKIGPDLWHPVGQADAAATAEAKAVCRECPVRLACLQRGLTDPGRDPGVWGGFHLGDPADRRRAQKWSAKKNAA